MKCIETKRLLLRTWEQGDDGTLYQINQDPKVIEFVPPLSMEQTKKFIVSCNDHSDKLGYTIWATCLKETAELIGFIGLRSVSWEAHFTPAVEIAWRLGSQHWGKGYATEGAKASLAIGFNKYNLNKIVSFTVPKNIRSIRVMEKIGMHRVKDGDFAHPKLSPDHPLSKHVLYEINREDFKSPVVL
ncbi:MAG: hypothetical protein A2007_02950 [Verrucomicrobia bacterium GWC2_42_7]|nr:MAG: hypothetical protein A2007_02950 [Verrucomicrobia bacterium GWC2_42_7]